MAIEFVSYAAAVSLNDASPISIGRPPGASSGDVLVSIAAVSTNGVSLSLPSGWVELASRTDWWPVRTSSVRTAYRVVGPIGSEPLSYDFPKTAPTFGGGAIVCYRGVDSSSPIAVASTSSASFTSSDSWTIPGVTTMVGNAELVALAVRSGSATRTLAGWTKVVDFVATGNPLVFTKNSPLAGATGDFTMTGSENSGAAFLTALRPASGDPPGPTAKPWAEAFMVE